MQLYRLAGVFSDRCFGNLNVFNNAQNLRYMQHTVVTLIFEFISVFSD